MNPSPIRTASHIGLWIMGIGIIIWLVYAGTHTNTEKNWYAAESKPVDNTVNHNGFRVVDNIDLFNFSCAPKALMEKGLPKSEVKK